MPIISRIPFQIHEQNKKIRKNCIIKMVKVVTLSPEELQNIDSSNGGNCEKTKKFEEHHFQIFKEFVDMAESKKDGDLSKLFENELFDAVDEYFKLYLCGIRVNDNKYPKLNTIETIKSFIKMKILEIYKVDITNPGFFPNHRSWWLNYKRVLKNEGKLTVNHHKPLSATTLDSFQDLIVLLFDISDSRNKNNYDELVSKLPVEFHGSWNKLLGHSIQFMIQLFFCMRGCEVLDQIKVSSLVKRESEDLEYAYFELVERPSDKNHKDDLEKDGSGGSIPFLEVTPGFNPGLMLEKYLALRPTDALPYLLLHAKNFKKKPQELRNPFTQLFEPNRKIGKNYVQIMSKEISLALGLDKGFTNHQLRTTAIQVR